MYTVILRAVNAKVGCIFESRNNSVDRTKDLVTNFMLDIKV